ncbi:glycosyltransferase [Pannus brasiliensis CCIBt3594]|uniref:Glycosyltransferase n=1 Tax=Pannus brasiliensis CCIBt3594 TaxID=1427578 RepID=A0AAW9QWD0_9CHRO
MTRFFLFITAISLVIWLYLLFFRGRFWRSDQKLDADSPTLSRLPVVRAVIPARNEAESLPISLSSLFSQDYAGDFSIVLVDDCSSDGTAEVAREIAGKFDRSERLTVLTGQPLPAGWTGKLWAMKQGIARATGDSAIDYLLLTDADIEHDRTNLSRLISKAERENQALVSVMVALRCQSFWEKFLIPAFVFFFEKLYPFPSVNNPNSTIAAAAGGCILIRRDILEKIGGIEILKDALIDDCSLAIAVKNYIRSRPEIGTRSIWLGLSETTRSIRPYPDLETIWNMVARTAFTQLNYSPFLLIGTIIGMFITYLAAPIGLVIGLLFGNKLLAIVSSIVWLLMAVSYWPTLKLYGLSIWRSLTLPFIAVFYSLMTVDSAFRYWRGQGGAWKGRVYPGR